MLMPPFDPVFRGGPTPQTPVTVRSVSAAGRDAVVLGGSRWTGGMMNDGELLSDAWIWRAPQ